MTTLSITRYLHDADGREIGEVKGERIDVPWLSSFVAVDDLVTANGRRFRVTWRAWDEGGNLVLNVTERVQEERAA